MAQYYEAIGRRKESTARVRLMDWFRYLYRERKGSRCVFPARG